MRSQGELAAAAKNFEKALILLTEVEDHAHKAIVQMNLGANYDAQGNAAQGLQLLEEAEPILRSLSDEMNLAKLLTNKGLCYLTLQFYEQAEIAFAQSAGLFEALNDLSWYLNARDGLGITYLERNWFDRALQIFESVAARLDEIKGTPAHGFLSTTLVKQLEQARSKNVNRGSSVYKVDPKR
ncbi:MAG: tetratricopeptide repeat protein [Caldilineaceae bacterium]